ncbi:MAG: type II secretion system protein [Janthinobacterium lividum]
MKQVLRRRQRGVSLVEVAIASMILGACGVFLLGLIDRQTKVASGNQSLSMIDRAHDTILAYAYLHGRLPCPAQVTTGIESCDGKSDGYLPYLTLGLPDSGAGRVRYRMAPDTSAPAASHPYRIVAGQRSGKFNELFAQAVPLASIALDGHEPLLDLCQALGSSTHSAEIAYALALDPGVAASPSSSSTPTAGPLAPTQTVGRAQLAAKLHCGNLAVAGRAHFNTALAADTMDRAMDDILAQFLLLKYTYSYDLLQGLYFEASSIDSLATANTKRLGALAASQASNGANSAALGMATYKTLAAGIYTAALTLNVARFVTNLARAEEHNKILTKLKQETEKSAVEIKGRAVIGSSSAFFLEDKWSQPAP